MTRRAPLGRYGGKAHLAAKIISHFPSAETYLEPFFGCGSVFFSLPPGQYQKAVVNDLDGWVVRFFRALRDKAPELIEKAELTPYALDEYKAAQVWLKSGKIPEDDVEVARLFWVLSRQAYGHMLKPNNGWNRAHHSTFAAHAKDPEAWRAFVQRLQGVGIDNIDGWEFVRRHRHRGVFVYADPPYTLSSRVGGKAYTKEMTDADHRALAAALHETAAMGAKVALSGYDSSLYGELYGGWRRVEFAVSATSSAGRTSGHAATRTEVLWLSYPPFDRPLAPQATTELGKRLQKLRRGGR